MSKQPGDFIMKPKACFEKLAKSFDAIRNNKDYLRESEELEAGISTTLPKEKHNWWIKQSNPMYSFLKKLTFYFFKN